MKTIQKVMATIAFSFLMLASGLAQNTLQNHLITKVKPAGTDKAIDIQLANLLGQRTVLMIRDVDGKLWFYQKIKEENGFHKRLDLRFLEDGYYTVRVSNRTDKAFHSFAVNGNEITLAKIKNNESEEGSYAMQVALGNTTSRLIARVTTSEGKPSLEVQLANLLQKEAIIRLGSVDGAGIVTDKIRNEHGYHKAFNMANMRTGDYYLAIQTGQLTTFQYFSLTEEGIQLHNAQQFEEGVVGERLALSGKR